MTTTAPIVPAKKVKQLGAARGRSYIEHNGREYLLRRGDASSDLGRQVPGEIVVTSTEEVDDGHGYLTRRQVNVRAEPVERGTFEAVSSRLKPKSRELPLRVWDQVAALPSMQSREPVRISTHPPDGNPLLGPLRGMIGMQTTDFVEVAGNEAPPAARSAAGYIAHLRERGILLDLAAHGHRLLVKSRKPISLEDRALIGLTEELLIGELSGRRIVCAFDDGLEAVTVAYPHLPVCEEHAR